MSNPLYVFPDPRAAVKALLNAAKAARWPTATISTSFPEPGIAVPHIQHAWDGTPSQQVNRQVTSIRVTVWAPKGRVDDSIELAQLAHAYLLDAGSSSVWRFRPGAGPVSGVDSDIELPFCSFTLNAETRPTAVA